MSPPLKLECLERPGYTIELFVPDAQEVQSVYLRQKEVQSDIPFPHWTKIWPSALALADFLHRSPEVVQQKNVLELAAGLGLPGLVAARHAQQVCISDYLEEAVDTVTKSIQHLQLTNVTSLLLDWNHLPEDLTTDVLLLSDINYDPEEFSQLFKVLQKFLHRGTLILLTTPQRLMAKPFIEKLLPFCRQQHEIMIGLPDQQTPVSLLMLLL